MHRVSLVIDTVAVTAALLFILWTTVLRSVLEVASAAGALEGTGTATDEEVRAALEGGATGCIAKGPSGLVTELDELLTPAR